jgi:hypothetical protein
MFSLGSQNNQKSSIRIKINILARLLLGYYLAVAYRFGTVKIDMISAS